VRHVTEALRRLDGIEVKDVAVEWADVSFDPAKTSAAAIAAAVTAAGYPAQETVAPGARRGPEGACRSS
jgi:copper chaperone CopZ